MNCRFTKGVMMIDFVPGLLEPSQQHCSGSDVKSQPREEKPCISNTISISIRNTSNTIRAKTSRPKFSLHLYLYLYLSQF